MKVDDKARRLLFEPQEVLVVNTEAKMLPFRAAADLFDAGCIKTTITWAQFMAVMNAVSSPDKLPPDKQAFYRNIKVVFVDSFTRILFLLKEHLNEQGVTGHAFWAEYGKEIERLLMLWKMSGKFLIYTAIDEVVRSVDNIERKVAKVQGKQIEGLVESFFEICLFAHYNRLKDGSEAYQFMTNTDGYTSAKTPVGMFDTRYIQNDMSAVLYRVYEYYSMKEHPGFNPPSIIVCGQSGYGKSTSVGYLFGDLK